MNNPLVSIIIPLHNGGKYLAETVQSALNQTWQHKEIIIIDDGSTDSSLQIAKSFESEIVKVFTQQNLGASAARNTGLKEAKGDYIQFLDADDLLSPDKIEGQIACLNGKFTNLAICKTIHFQEGDAPGEDDQGDEWFSTGSNNPIDFLTKLYAGDELMPGYGGMIAVHSWLTPKMLIDKAGPWNEKLSLDDDGEFFCRVVLASEMIKFSDKGFNYYRKYNNRQSLSAQKNKKAIESTVLAIDLKLEHLKTVSQDEIINRVFAKHYWWTGVMAYPQFKNLSAYCIKKAKQLGYSGERYVGGRSGHTLSAFAGWKIARLMAYYRELLKKEWA
jgi:glycosyltransferase involved in cell wall biosynthesis